MDSARKIFFDVMKNGKRALLEWTENLENHAIKPKGLRVSGAEADRAGIIFLEAPCRVAEFINAVCPELGIKPPTDPPAA